MALQCAEAWLAAMHDLQPQHWYEGQVVAARLTAITQRLEVIFQHRHSFRRLVVPGLARRRLAMRQGVMRIMVRRLEEAAQVLLLKSRALASGRHAWRRKVRYGHLLALCDGACRDDLRGPARHRYRLAAVPVSMFISAPASELSHSLHCRLALSRQSIKCNAECANKAGLKQCALAALQCELDAVWPAAVIDHGQTQIDPTLECVHLHCQQEAQ
jgi:hypothetical protein